MLPMHLMLAAVATLCGSNRLSPGRSQAPTRSTNGYRCGLQPSRLNQVPPWKAVSARIAHRGQSESRTQPRRTQCTPAFQQPFQGLCWWTRSGLSHRNGRRRREAGTLGVSSGHSPEGRILRQEAAGKPVCYTNSVSTTRTCPLVLSVLDRNHADLIDRVSDDTNHSSRRGLGLIRSYQNRVA